MSVDDLFTLALGFEFAGAVLLGMGIYRNTPARLSEAMGQGGNTFARFNVREMEDKANAELGFFGIALGFMLQAVGYSLASAGVWRGTPSWAAAEGAAIFGIVGAGAVFGLWRVVYRPRVKKLLVDVAHFDRWGTRHATPSLQELVLYGRLLGDEMTTHELRNEEGHREYVKRVFGVEQTHAPSEGAR